MAAPGSLKLRIRLIASAALIASFVLIGCSDEHELAVVNQRSGSPLLDKGSVSNPLQIQKPAGKALISRAGKKEN
jgi:hypothetical protein